MLKNRSPMFLTFDEAPNAGPYDELPMLPLGIDPQLHMSNNDRPQPFWLTHEKDAVLILMGGAARIEMREGPVLWEDLIPGDFLYVPGGTPHRFIPKEPSVVHRLKAERSGLEAASWYCEVCSAPLWKFVWDTARHSPQAGYLGACEKFNRDESLRRCSTCKTVHTEIDLAPYRWVDIAERLQVE